MDPEVLTGVSLTQIAPRDTQVKAAIERLGIDPSESVGLGTCIALQFAYDAIRSPPVYPAAPLASAAALRVPPDGADRMSFIPNQILWNIVSRLPAKDAARTGALASRWRGLWRSVPLALVDAQILPASIPDRRMPPGGDDVSCKAVVAAASRALATHPGPFCCVHVTRAHMTAHKAKLEQWIQLLAAKGVQELVFVNRPWPMDLPLPDTLFKCGASLTRLHLGAWRFPSTRSLPRLP